MLCVMGVMLLCPLGHLEPGQGSGGKQVLLGGCWMEDWETLGPGDPVALSLTRR